MPTNGDLVRTSGLCSICDFQFRDEVVARYPERAMPGGWAYVELRHLKPDEIEALNGITAKRVVPPRPEVVRGDPVACFAASVRQRRMSLKLTQEAAADRADMNMSYWSRIERGVVDPGLRTVSRVAAALDTNLAILLEGGSPPTGSYIEAWSVTPRERSARRHG